MKSKDKKSSGRSKSSGAWLRNHFDDPYVKEAQRLGYRSRAAFKLLELQERDRLFKPGMTVVDLGAGPGGWSQIACDLVGARGTVLASDILPMDALAGVDFVQGDFTDDAVLDVILARLDGRPVDLVISDMAPNMSGMRDVDQPRAMYLVELSMEFSRRVLKPGGAMAVKLFHGEGFDEFMRDARGRFDKVLTRKPKSSRPKSREVYLVAKGFRSAAPDGAGDEGSAVGR